MRSIVARVGSDELGLDPMGLNETDSFLVLQPRCPVAFQGQEELIDAIRQAAEGIPGVNLSFTQPIGMRTSEMLSGVRGDLAVKVFGPNAEGFHPPEHADRPGSTGAAWRMCSRRRTVGCSIFA